MARSLSISGLAGLLALVCVPGMAPAATGKWILLGWNNLGMHCMDGDYSVFSLLPPYNTIVAQLIDPQGHLVVGEAGITVTYEAKADPDGSTNSTSIGKTNFWEHVEDLFGTPLAPDDGLAGAAMPGAGRQRMVFDAAAAWFIAEGIPVTPYDDDGRRRFYPILHLVARSSSGERLAETDVVVPVSDEMSCAACHASNSSPPAAPIAGWVDDPDPQRDFRLNILRLHDDREQTNPRYQQALAALGYDSAGLFATAKDQGRAVLCARCHASEALAGSGFGDIEPLTQAIHRRMAYTLDPVTGLPLAADENRTACYRCHPGSETRCLRGPMGNAVAADGSRSIQCQSCHGGLLDLAAPARRGWLDEPRCQSCHRGTAVGGSPRSLSVFDEDGKEREPSDPRFATVVDTPLSGTSLFRFSRGHGGLYCSACHGSTHAELPSAEGNDNLQAIALQGHAGTVSECEICHASSGGLSATGGPHGLHPLGAAWVERHGDIAEEGGAAACRACHGEDFRGSELSRAQADRVLNTEFGTKRFWRGFQVGCYTCHLGPGNERRNPNSPPVVDDLVVHVEQQSQTIALVAHDADGQPSTLRIVSQPGFGRVSLSGSQATYFREDGPADDSFTYAASDGSSDSNLGTVTIHRLSSCRGDCDGDGAVTVDELVQAVTLALNGGSISTCSRIDANQDSQVTVDEILGAVAMALEGCPI